MKTLLTVEIVRPEEVPYGAEVLFGIKEFIEREFPLFRVVRISNNPLPKEEKEND